MFKRIATLARNIRQSEEGAVAIHMAFMVTAMLGIAALAIDIGFAYFKQRQMQSAADGAAYSAAIAKSTGHPTAFRTEAYAVAGMVGFVNGSNGVTITVNNPPVSPPASATDAANASAVQVIIRQPQSLPLVSLLYSGAFNVSAQAVASAGSGSACALQLSSSANPGVTISNGAAVTLMSCGMAVCSTGSTALTVTGGAALKLTDKSGNLSSSQSVSVAGSASVSNGASINNIQNTCTTPCKAHQGACAASVDPYAGVTMPTMPGGCSLGKQMNYPWTSGNPAYTLSPGVWCNGVIFGQGLTYKLNPGVYYVNGGTFNPAGGATLIGTGVTIVLTGSASNSYSPHYANVSIGNGSTVTLSAPTTGATSGILFFGDRSAPLSNTNSFQGGAVMSLTGAIYLPTQTAVFSNGVSNPSGCTQLIAGVINFAGGAQFSNNCAGMGTSSIGGATTLVE